MRDQDTQTREDARTVSSHLQHLRFPGESNEYRAARNTLLEEEMALRRQLERVAALRQSLPPGGLVTEDYVFEGVDVAGRPTPMKLSGLFGPAKDTLAIYSFMYGPERDKPCPGCTHLLDCLDGATRHVTQRFNFVVVAKLPLARLLAFAKERGWNHLVLLSTANNSYDRDYFGDTEGLSKPIRQQQHLADGKDGDMPMLNVFRRHGDVIRHFWGSELLYVPPEPGQEYRHGDLIDPVWGLLDNTPEGRGDFRPMLDYA